MLNSVQKIKEIIFKDGAVNNLQMTCLVTICRSIAVIFLFWFVWSDTWFDSVEQSSQIFSSFAPVSMGLRLLIMAYILIISVPYVFTYRRPFFVLNEKWFSITAIFEIILIITASWMYPKHEQVLVFMLVLPLSILSRFSTIRRVRYLVLISWIAIFLQSLAVWASEDSNLPTQLLTDSPLLALLMTIIIVTLYRHHQQNQSKLIRSNLEFAIERIMELTDAAVCFLRVPTTYDGTSTLFLIVTGPLQAYQNLFYPDVIALDNSAHSIVTTTYRTQTVQSVHTKDALRNSVTQMNPIREYDLKKGMALPIPAFQGAVSIYWDKEEISLNAAEKTIYPHLKYLSSYLKKYETHIQSWVQNTSKRRLIPTGDWAETNKLTQQLFRNTNVWESAQLLVEGITRIANARGACILFFNEEARTFAADPNGKGISPDCSLTLVKGVYRKDELSAYLKKQESNCLSLHLPMLDGETRLEVGECLAFPLRTKEYKTDSNIDLEWKWIGLLLLDLPDGEHLTVLKHRQLEMVALNGATDLRNCQLHLKSETDRHAQDTLTQIIQSLFNERTIPKDEIGFLKVVRHVLLEGLDTPNSTTLGIISPPYDIYDKVRWISTSNIEWTYMLQCPEQGAEIQKLLDYHDTEQNICLFDYEAGKTEAQRFHLSRNIKQSYGIAIPLDNLQNGSDANNDEMLIIYVNYSRSNPEDWYTTRRILSILFEPIQQSWRMWHRWHQLVDQERAYQRQFWHNEIHDQLNELQSNVMRPLELLILHLDRAGLQVPKVKAEKIHRGTRGINATLKQVNQDIRDRVYHHQGLFAALENLSSRTSKCERLTVSCSGTEPTPGVAGPVYLIAREAVVNAFKHGAKNCEIVVCSSRKNDVKLSICDDGGGYDGELREGSGIGIMRYQAQLIGAKISWTICSESEGTQVLVVRNSETKGHIL